MSTNRDKEFWSSTWKARLEAGPEHPDQPTWRNDMERRRLDFLQPYLPADGRVVDVGVGSGRLLARIGHASGLELTGVDYSTESLNLIGLTAETFAVKIQPICGDARQLPLPDAFCDLVTSGGLLEHFEDLRPVLAEMVRILKPGGVFYADVVPRKAFSLHRPLHRIRGPKVYRSSFTATDYGRWLTELGCEDVKAMGCGVYPPAMHLCPAGPRRWLERVFRRLDGTAVGDALGYYLLVVGRRV